MQKLYEDPYGIYALVLTPIRELAFQIADQFAILGKPMNMRTCVVVGGMDMVEQGRQLSKLPHVVVATPGRLVDHLEGCDTFTLSRIKFLVIDEADRLLGRCVFYPTWNGTKCFTLNIGKFRPKAVQSFQICSICDTFKRKNKTLLLAVDLQSSHQSVLFEHYPLKLFVKCVEAMHKANFSRIALI